MTLDRSLRPDVSAIGHLALSPWQTRLLPNGAGLHIVASPHATEMCRIAVAIPGGIVESPRPMMFKTVASVLAEGSERHPSPRMADILEAAGVLSSAVVHTHHTLLTHYCLRGMVGRVLPLIREMVFTPAFSPESVDRVGRLIASGEAVSSRKVSTRASRALNGLMYGSDSPLAATATPEEILAFTSEMLCKAHFRRLDSSKMHIFLAGGITDEITEAVAAEFGSLYTYPISYKECHPAFPTIKAPHQVVTPMPDALQNAVAMAIPTPGRDHPDFLNIRIAACALGGYFGSRLMAALREEKGLTYGIGASLYGYSHNGFLVLSTETDCANTSAVIDATVAEIERLKDPSSFTADEIERLRSFLLSCLAAVLDTPFQRMDFLQSEILAGTPADYFARQQAAIRAITPEAIAATARAHFSLTQLLTSVAGKV